VFGLHAVEALLSRNPQQIERILLDAQRRDPRMQHLRELARTANVVVESVDREELETLAGSGQRHQGVVAQCQATAGYDENDLTLLLDRLPEAPFLLILDGVQDPHNLGACLRSADAAGVHAVIAPKDRASGLTATARKVASGAAETVPYVQVTNLARSLRMLKERGIWLVGAAGEADIDLYQQDLSGPLALVLGAEGQGLRRLTREECDYLVKIPLHGTVASLNVSVACGICLFEARRQRG
jgi:23S rRNA (guanosine2251-2'-O)-methyltransferase